MLPVLAHRSVLAALASASIVCLTLLAAAAPPAAAQSASEMEGAWAAERYLMAGGGEHAVEGRIFFTRSDWQVLFFVMDESGTARRGSGEGGTYTFEGGQLVFSHLFNLSVGDAMQGLPAADLQMVSRPAEGAPLEPTDVTVAGNVLTLHFPSGNRLIFRRSS